MDTDDDEMNDRMCIVTREPADPERMLRFVAGPDGVVVPDLKRDLPGRGCWVTAERSKVEQAAKKNLFSKGLKRKVTVPEDLADLIDRLILRQFGGMVNLARKAGQFVTGAVKVNEAVRSGEALATFHASDAAEDGVHKIDKARKATAMLLEEDAIPSFRMFSEAQLAELLGGNAFIHAAALAGQAGQGVVKRAKQIQQYRGIGTVTTDMGKGGPERP